MERLFGENDIDFLTTLCNTCRARSTYKFNYAGMSTVLQRYINKSEEYNNANQGLKTASK